MDQQEQIRVGDRVFRRRSDLFAKVLEVKPETVMVSPEWPHDGSTTEWPISEVRIAGVFE